MEKTYPRACRAEIKTKNDYGSRAISPSLRLGIGGTEQSKPPMPFLPENSFIDSRRRERYDPPKREHLFHLSYFVPSWPHRKLHIRFQEDGRISRFRTFSQYGELFQCLLCVAFCEKLRKHLWLRSIPSRKCSIARTRTHAYFTRVFPAQM